MLLSSLPTKPTCCTDFRKSRGKNVLRRRVTDFSGVNILLVTHDAQLPDTVIEPYASGRAQCCVLSETGFEIPSWMPGGNDEFVHTRQENS